MARLVSTAMFRTRAAPFINIIIHPLTIPASFITAILPRSRHPLLVITGIRKIECGYEIIYEIVIFELGFSRVILNLNVGNSVVYS